MNDTGYVVTIGGTALRDDDVFGRLAKLEKRIEELEALQDPKPLPVAGYCPECQAGTTGGCWKHPWFTVSYP